jgi:hypothetical protein
MSAMLTLRKKSVNRSSETLAIGKVSKNMPIVYDRDHTFYYGWNPIEELGKLHS